MSATIESGASVLSVDLAHRSYADVGVCLLSAGADGIDVTPISLPERGLAGSPAPAVLARAIADLCEEHAARLVLLDGPQAWKAPDNGLDHSRVCERRLATQGKTGLPGFAKPGPYLPFIAFSIEVFDRLAELGWPRLPSAAALASREQFALESFPTAAWRSLGLPPLPGKSNRKGRTVEQQLAELRRCVPLSIAGSAALTHDELQALVAGLAGVGANGHASCEVSLCGVDLAQLDGTWREGFIATPVRRAGTAAT
jgi:hypothetical protein